MSDATADLIELRIAKLSAWIDGSYPADLDPEAHIRRRVDKLMEEVGEVGEAVGGMFGENPRKGFTHTRADVLAELLDVMVTAAGAYESLTGNKGTAMQALDTHVRRLLVRVGLEEES